MSDRVIAERYATALFECISGAAELEETSAALDQFAGMYSEQRLLQQATGNLAIPRINRREALQAVLDRAGFSSMVKRFLLLMFDRDRMAIVGNTATVFRGLVDKRLDRVMVTVTTATSLTAGQRNRIRASLEVYTGKDVRLEEELDTSILGGVVARIDGKIIDGSLRARLNQIRRELLGGNAA